MKVQLSSLAQSLKGQLVGTDLTIDGVSIDTRSLQAGQLYVAIQGLQFDGHQFIEQAAQQGAAAALVSRELNSPLPQIVVGDDTRLTLGRMAANWRQQLPVKVVGVTGSNGKTTVKEMIAAILATQGPTLYTQGNLNNDIGVPLTLLRLTEQHRFAVIEMGANHPGEIAYTSQLAKPDVVVINNVGAAHIEGFGSLQGVAQTKGEIIDALADDGVAVLNRDDAFYEQWPQRAAGRKVVSFGFDAAADVRAEQIQGRLQGDVFVNQFDLIVNDQRITMKLNLLGEHNVKNALAATAVALQLGVSLDDVQRGLQQLKPVTGRMQPWRGRKGNLIIDDTYNANPSSLQAALDAVQVLGGERWLILGAFGELGEDSADMHRDLAPAIKAAGFSQLWATGALTEHTVNAFGAGAHYFKDQSSLIDALQPALSGQETLLIKGSRTQKMEQVAAALVDHFRAA